MKSHLQSYPCPLQINSFWNLGFLLGITIILQIITGIFLSLHYTSDLNSAYPSLPSASLSPHHQTSQRVLCDVGEAGGRKGKERCEKGEVGTGVRFLF